MMSRIPRDGWNGLPGRECGNAAGMRGFGGFTLVEIMIVVALIGMLATIAIPSYLRARDRARQAACINNLRMIDLGKSDYALEYGMSNGAALTWDNVLPYVSHGMERCICPSAPDVRRSCSNSYRLNGVGVSPECLIAPDIAGAPYHSLSARFAP